MNEYRSSSKLRWIGGAALAGAVVLSTSFIAGPGTAGATSIGSARGLAARPVTHSPDGGTGAGFLGGLNTISKVASTVPSLGTGKPGNGDVNPYGVAVVPRTVGHLVAGDVLVSNFNDSANLQGTGRTIVQISPAGAATVFANLPGVVGLTTALSVFRNGDVVVGSLPTTNGMSATAKAGALYILNSAGTVVETLKGGPINGPWDMADYDGGQWGVLFVTNVLNQTVAGGGATVDKGTVLRIVLDFSVSPPKVDDEFIIGTGFGEATNPAALVQGPTGVALSTTDTLYIADTLGNRVVSIPDALFRRTPDGTGTTLTTGDFLNGPLGLTMAPNGDILTVNGNDGEITETTPAGAQINWLYLNTTGSPEGAGALFGLAVQPGNKGLYFVDDDENQLNLFH